MKKHSYIYISFFFLSFTGSFRANSQASVLLGKSFVNITRPSGGTVVPGDELEIRLSLFVYTGTTNFIYRVRYNDTIPTGLNFVSGSLKLLTNEGVLYKSYTDAGNDDQAMYNSINRTVRFNLGRDTTVSGFAFPVRNVNATTTDTVVGGGYFNRANHRPRAGGGSLGSGMLLLVTYRVTVDAATPFNSIINYGPGALRYRRTVGAGAADDQITASPNSLSFIVYPNYGLCANATGANNVSAGNGNFGSGTAQNGPSPGAAVPGYVFGNITTNFPGDGSYSVVKNVSPSQNTNPFVARPQSPSVDRVFGVWDIIGDHTNAPDQLAGNAPAASGANAGYMLVVNSALQLSVANNQTISGLCEETFYEFSAWFRNVCKRCGSDSMGRGASNISVPAGYLPLPGNDSSGVKPNLTFQINGVDYYTTGNIDYAGTWGEWVKKGFVFKTGTAQTSVTISIKNNAPGGGGNDWAMDDITLATCLPALVMRPSNNPTYCLNNQVDISVAVSTFFDNYFYYQWERSTDGGTTWDPAPESPGIQTFTYTNFSGEYRDTVSLPSFVANASYNGYRYRIKVATSLTNLTLNSCSVYNSTDVITININESCDVLPAKLNYFNAVSENTATVIKWTASGDANLIAFEVEKSRDARTFEKAGAVAKKTDAGFEYRFTDSVPYPNKTYYRLKLLTTNAAVYKYSDVVSVSANIQNQFLITGLVNPFETAIRFNISSSQSLPVVIYLRDMAGRKILTQQKNIIPGNNSVLLSYPQTLQQGSYILQVVYPGGSVINSILQKK
ncbi:MAG: hypothetical protein K2Q24_04825 [Chitinophagaceae bacterium]|nr:hypothetical protein [Chitinophagaceae bacterium]